jgi:hypothetical protein
VAQGTGKKQRAHSERGRLQRPDLSAFYNQRISSIEPGQFTFRTILVRPEQERADRYLTLDRATATLDWGDEEGSVLGGNLTLRRPGPERVAALPVQKGHRIRLQLLWGGRWLRMWDLRVPEVPTVDHKTGTLTVELADDLSALHLNEKEWDFKKDKQHPGGWTADQITRFVCRDQRVRVGRLAKATKKIKKLKLKGSGLEVIRKAWAMEKKETSERYVIRFRDGRLDVLPFARPQTLFVIKGIEKEASDSAESDNQRPITSIKAFGRIKTGKKQKKIEETVQSKVAIGKFGFAEEERHYGRVDSRAELREEAKRDLASEIKVTRTAVLTLPGIPFLEKGSTILWRTEEPGWVGKIADTNRDRAFAYVTSSHHTLSSGSYDTEVNLSQDDIYFADRKRRDEARRDEKKKERNGRKPAAPKK